MRRDCHKDFMSPRETLLKQDLFPRRHSGAVACRLKGKQSLREWDPHSQAKFKCCRIASQCLAGKQCPQFGSSCQTVC